ncbi:MAG: Adenylate cyclase, family 3 (some protein containing domain) [candidate division NC10 bacterium]|nr:Adenylate cyclase, family 3 (some protein containing domain) [candidate division NC10 bacterium]
MRRIFGVPASAERRFIAGTLGEIEELFGGSTPALPEGPAGSAPGERFLVDLFPPIRKSLRELIEHIYRGLSAGSGEQGAFGSGKDAAVFDQFEQALEKVLAAIVEQERRLGLMNLFWLAHSKVAADVLQEFFSQQGVRLNIKYQMHPFLAGVHRNPLDRVWARFKHQNGNALRQNLGGDFNTTLIDCIVDDQLALTETSVGRLNFQQVLVDNNKRFRLTFPEFRDVHATFRDRLREILRRRDPRTLEWIRRWLPDVRPDAYEEERCMNRLLFNSRAVTYVLAELTDSGEAAPRSAMQRSDRLPRRRWSDLVPDYLDLIEAVKRSEAVDLARQSVDVVGQLQAEAELRVRYEEGRLFRFYPDGEILKLSRKITVVFADLRGFTAASEGGISERELAQQLYAVFDPFASLVERYHGRIDKFTGDGAMITFGFSQVTPDDELNALRTALAIQDMMARLRATGQTRFSMGISVHTGRAQVAHFVVDDRTMDRTVIGRNVNIAGRLSGSAKIQGGVMPGEALENVGPARADRSGARREVWVDESGILFNTGIVVSQDTVEEIVRRGKAEPWTHGVVHGYRVFDDIEKKNILLEYVGDAKFRGVGRSIAIYRLGVGEVGVGRGAAPSRGRP